MQAGWSQTRSHCTLHVGLFQLLGAALYLYNFQVSPGSSPDGNVSLFGFSHVLSPANRPTRQQKSSQPANQPVNQPTNHSTNQPAKRPTARQPANPPTRRPANQPVVQPTGEPTSQSSNRPTSQLFSFLETIPFFSSS